MPASTEHRPIGPRDRVVLAAASAAAAASAFLFVTGGGRLVLGGFTVSARGWTRPALLAAALLLVYLARLRRPQPQHAVWVSAGEGLALCALGAATLLPISLWWYYLVKACGGLDSHGYVSTAALLAGGRLTLPLPVSEWLPFPGAIDAATPLGYVPSIGGHAAVPRFPLGLPIVMALFRLVLGPDGPFYVAPTLATATVALTWTLVRQSSGVLAGGLAAALVAVHPVFITYAVQPMSDVPATFWVVLAVYLLGRERPAPIIAGMSVGMAMLTRPMLALPAVVLAVVLWRRTRSDAIRLLAGFVPLLAVHLFVSVALYGSPASSGYGSPSNLFAIEAIPRNLSMYTRLVLDVHTPIFPVLVAAAWFAGLRGRVAVAYWLFAAVAAPYMLYALFYDDWETLRFLLPGLVFLVMAAAHAADRLGQRLVPRVMAPIIVAVVVAGAGVVSYRHLDERQVFRLWIAESKYPAVAEWVARQGNTETIVFASLHSGSVRYYSGRTTVRWDRIPPDRLAATVDAAGRRGRRMLLVLDGVSERDEFRRRFGTDPAGVQIEFVDRIQNVNLATVAPRPEP